MRRFLRVGILGCGAMLAAWNASAQYGGPSRDDRGRGSREYYDQHDNGDRRGRYDDRRGDAVSLTLADLDRAQSWNYRGRGRGEFDKARADLLRFREQWIRGRFDRGRLDNAIGHVQRLLGSGWLNPRDRQALGRDLYALREFRENRPYSPR